MTIERPDVVSAICKLLYSTADDGKFGVILGPAGTGKTHATISACAGQPWILYREIIHPSFVAEELAVAIGMPEKPTIFDRVLELFGINTFSFPHDDLEAITYVLETLAERAAHQRRINNLNVLPCLVIDGAEQLAISNPSVLAVILRLANVYANAKMLRIVFVDSEGHVMSLIKQTTSKHRLAEVVEVLDLSNEDAEEYLIKCSNMSGQLARRLVDVIGGRIVYLSSAVDVYMNNTNLSDDMIFKKIWQHFYVSIVENAVNVFLNNTLTSKTLIKQILLRGPLFPSEMKNFSFPTDPIAVQGVINDLIKAGLLRYRADGKLTWHSKFVATEFLNFIIQMNKIYDNSEIPLSKHIDE